MKPILNRTPRNEKERRYLSKHRIKAVRKAWNSTDPLVPDCERSVQAELGSRNSGSGHISLFNYNREDN